MLQGALDLEPGERPAYLDRACGDDDELRRLVERLIVNCEEDTNLTPVGGGLPSPFLSGLMDELNEETSPEGTVIGRYRIVRELGRGGMAVVYLAERADGQFEQQVALKRVQRGFDTGDTVQRFDLERQILAQSHHPNIAQLMDGGVDPSGRPYFAMEYVEGRPIDQYCDDEQLTVRQRLELFLQVARAVEYAHRNLVVHRDIKPSNILVTADGHVKLLDFGIAKILDGTPDEVSLTSSSAQLMTPLYASPEQVRGEAVTTASDVYQLGVLLYLLLAGRWPYQIGEGHAGVVVRAICHDQPTRPSTGVAVTGGAKTGYGPSSPEAISEARKVSVARLRRQLAGDLDNIVLMSLRKEPERRYGSVAQFIDDIESFLVHRPISARPDTFLYRAGKLVRRHKGAVLTAVAATAVLISLAVFYTLELARERDRARLAAARATSVSDFLRGLFEVSAPTRSKGEQVTARELLDRGARRIEGELADQPELQAGMMTLMGDVYRELALYEEAQSLLERAEALRRQPGGDDLELADTVQALARVREEQGDHAGAEKLYREALYIRQGVERPDDLKIAQSLNGLGRALKLQGDFENARQHHEEALALLESSLGRDHPEIGRTLTGLGEVLTQVREFEPARGLLERALAILEDAYEPDHPFVAHTKVYLATALRFTGDGEGARAQYESALPLLEQVYGPEHPEVASALTRLGNLLNAIDEPDEAIVRHQEALAIREAALGSGHPLVASSLNNIGLAYWRKRDLVTAQGFLERSVEKWEAALGPDHVDVAIALRNLAEALQRNGALEEAVPLYERVLEIRQRAYGSEHSLLASPLYLLGWTKLDLGDPAAAETLLRRALTLAHRQSEVIWARVFLGKCLLALQRYPEAEETLLESLREVDEDLEARSWTYEALIELYERWAKPEQEARMRRELAALDAKAERPAP